MSNLKQTDHWQSVSEPQITDDEPDFRSDLSALLNRYSKENRSDTPDWILRDFLCDSLRAFDRATRKRSGFCGGKNSMTTPTNEERWVSAKTHLDATAQAYLDIGMAGQLALVATIFPLYTRLAKGERTEELHDAIIALE